MEVPPLLVQVLGGNVVTAASVLACINTTNATELRRLHPALAAAVAAVPWADTTTQVRDTDRWRAALPAATALKLAARALLLQDRELVAFVGVTVLDLTGCGSVTDAVIARLPPTLRALNVSECKQVTQHASFTHLAALEVLDCSSTKAAAAGLANLPPSLRELHMHSCEIPITVDFSNLRHLRVMSCTRGSQAHFYISTATVASLPPSLEVLDIGSGDADITSTGIVMSYWSVWPRGLPVAHLTRLQVLNASYNDIDGAAIASLPPSLRVLNLEACSNSTVAASFAHLACLHTLGLRATPISSDTLATLPPSLVSLNLQSNRKLTSATVFPHLPALRVLNMSYTDIGDAVVASIPAGVEELFMVRCCKVTQHANLDHLTTLRVLQSAGTALSPAIIEACRARGCFAPAEGKLAPKHKRSANMMVTLPDGRLVSAGGGYRYVTLWEATDGHDAVIAELEMLDSFVTALAVLHDGYRVAIGMSSGKDDLVTPGIAFWDTPPEGQPYKRAINRAAIACDSNVTALAVAHHGHLMAGCADGKLCVVDVDARAVVATLAAHARKVSTVAVLLDGRVATASENGELKLWNVSTRVCVSTLTGHTNIISSLAVLPDGYLASGSYDTTVRLWDTVTGACVRVMKGSKNGVSELAVLAGDQLASTSNDGTIRVWNTHDGASGSLAQPLLLVAPGPVYALVPLPGNCLVTGGDRVYLWQLPPPYST